MPAILAILLTSAQLGDPYAAMRAADARLASIGDRLATTNVRLCDRLQPATGMTVHALAQYGEEDDAARRAFAFEGAVAVEAVNPGSPAERAGVSAGDTVVAVDREALTGGGEGVTDRDRALDLIERGSPTAPITLTLRRNGRDRGVVVSPIPACRARFEVLVGRGTYAGADARVVKLGDRLIARYSDEEIAVVAAHELAHVILRHADRLDSAKINRGLFKELGRNGRLFRRTEREADELGVVLLANAGFDPFAAARFWRTRGGEIDHGLFRARTHDSSPARAKALEAIASSIAGQPRPVLPTALLATRDRPLD